MPSWIRAPPESFSPMKGMPSFMARSMTLTILCACISPSDPPSTVKSWLYSATLRPPIVPTPVMTPSLGMT